MKKTFIYALMAATALCTLSLTACSDDDDNDIETENDVESVDICDYIIGHVLTVNDNDSIFASVYCDDYDATLKTATYVLDDGETAEDVFRDLVPDSLESKIIGTAPNLAFTFWQDNKTYTLAMEAGTGDNDAVITLPEAEPYSNHIRTLEITNHVVDNATNIDKYDVGQAYRLSGARMVTYNGATKEYNIAITGGQMWTSPAFYCFAKTKQSAYFFYTQSSVEKDLAYLTAEEKNFLNAEEKDRYYIFGELTTNDIYSYYHGLLPHVSLFEHLQQELLDNSGNSFLYNYGMANHDYDIENEGVEGALKSIFGTTRGLTFATNGTANSLFKSKRVQTYTLNDNAGGEHIGYVDKNHTNKVSIMYIYRLAAKEVVNDLNKK